MIQERVRPSEQVYGNYTQEDRKVWNILFNRQMGQLKNTACKEYLLAMDTIDFCADRIPDFERVDEKLRPLTGWGLQTVPNISEQKEFFTFLSQRKFTATCWLRSMDELDYLEEPDMFHDVFGHVPLLSNTQYTDFFHGISKIALEHINEPKIIELLGRIYWFTIEFGLIRQNGELKVYGAGICSSKDETMHCLSDRTTKVEFNVQKIFDTPFRTDTLQEKYFVIDSFDQLYASVPEIAKELVTRFGKRSV